MKAKPALRGVAERNALVEQFIHLPQWVWSRMAHYDEVMRLDFDDAMSAGRMALLRAAELWDENMRVKGKPVKFITYAGKCIKFQLISAGRANTLVHVPDGNGPLSGAKAAARCVYQLSYMNEVRAANSGRADDTDPWVECVDWDLADELESPADAVLAECEEREDQVRRLHDALGRLRRADRRLLSMRYFDGKSYGDIGSAMGKSRQWALIKVREAEDRLRAVMTGSVELRTTNGVKP